MRPDRWRVHINHSTTRQWIQAMRKGDLIMDHYDPDPKPPTPDDEGDDTGTDGDDSSEGGE